jgi:hypothetical protein
MAGAWLTCPCCRAPPIAATPPSLSPSPTRLCAAPSARACCRQLTPRRFRRCVPGTGRGVVRLDQRCRARMARSACRAPPRSVWVQTWRAVAEQGSQAARAGARQQARRPAHARWEERRRPRQLGAGAGRGPGGRPSRGHCRQPCRALLCWKHTPAARDHIHCQFAPRLLADADGGDRHQRGRARVAPLPADVAIGRPLDVEALFEVRSASAGAAKGGGPA